MSLSKVVHKLLLTENSSLKYAISRPPSRWVHDINKSRSTQGEFNVLYKQLRNFDEKFYEYLRMTKEIFDLLLSKVKGKLTKLDTNLRMSISAEERLVVTLRYLATGESYRSLAFHFRLGRSTVSEIVSETCNILWSTLKDEYMPIPTTEKWYQIANKYYNKWNFPNCIGAIDGKHIRVRCPSNSGSLFYCNYRKYFSILLQAVVDADCKIILVDIGAEGRQCDAGNFSSSSLFHMLETNCLNIPSEKEIPNTNIKMPFVLVGDGGYPLMNYLMRPFSLRNIENTKTIYNYRLSRARRSVECCFGIMAAKWRILLKAIETKVHTAISITKAVCILHNFIMTEDRSPFQQDMDSSTLSSAPMSTRTQYRFSNSALQIRDILLNYFNGSGSIPWQNNSLPENIILRHNIHSQQ